MASPRLCLISLVLLKFLSETVVGEDSLPIPPRPFEERESREIIEEDIVQLKGSSRNGIPGENFRWPGKTMPYYIESTFTADERSIILAAIQKINTLTNVLIRPYNQDDSYVWIRKGDAGDGCNSYVGRQSTNGQYLTLEATCLVGSDGKGNVMHELMHALGFRHEQTRADRDTYVELNISNILSGNFSDFSSIMHISKYAFAKDPRYPTIYSKAPNTDCVLGGSDLSWIDAYKIDHMYPLPGQFDNFWCYNMGCAHGCNYK